MDDSNLAKTVGRNIKEYRKLRRLTQKQLGDKVGVKHNTISSYESGTTEPEQNTLFAIAKALEVNVSDLFPSITVDQDDTLKKALYMANDSLNQEQHEFLKKLIEKTLSLDASEREAFIENIRFAIEYFDRRK